MIAQGKAISHGARAIEYSMEKIKPSSLKVHDLPENIRTFGYVVTDDATPASMYERQI